MSSRLTALSDGSGDGEIAVLAVHVVLSASWHVTQPDTHILDGHWLLFMNLKCIKYKEEKMIKHGTNVM